MQPENRNIWVIPTDKPSMVIKRRITNELKVSSLNNPQLWNNINIYITSDEEIKDGEYALYLFGNLVQKVKIGINVSNKEAHKKIILTTDQDLIKDGVQAIDDEFLEWFVKNPSCEEVEFKKKSRCCGRCNGVDDICYTDMTCDNHQQNGCEECYGKRVEYEIIIPKEEPSLTNMTCTCLRPSPGDFTANCRNCGFRIKDGFDHSLDVLKSAVKSKYPESAEDEVLDKIKFVLSAGNSGQAIRLLEQYGAYKQEGMYSKEDLKKAFEAGHDSARLKGSYKSNGTYQEDLSEFLNQFGSK